MMLALAGDAQQQEELEQMDSAAGSFRARYPHVSTERPLIGRRAN